MEGLYKEVLKTSIFLKAYEQIIDKTKLCQLIMCYSFIKTQAFFEILIRKQIIVIDNNK